MYCTNYCLVVSSTGDLEMAKELERNAADVGDVGVENFAGKDVVGGGDARIWRDVVSEIYADAKEEDAFIDKAPRMDRIPTPDGASSSSSVVAEGRRKDVDADANGGSSPTIQRRFPFFQASQAVDESVPIPANVLLFSEVRPSFSATLTQRHNVTVYPLYADPLPPTLVVDYPSSRPSSASSTRLFCLDPAGAVAVVRVSSPDSFAPSVLSALRSRRRLLLRLEGLILLPGGEFVVDASACVVDVEGSKVDNDAFPFPLAEAPRMIGAFDDDDVDVDAASSNFRVDDLVLFSGRILRIDFDNAFSERVCPECSSAVDDEAVEGVRMKVLCSVCEVGVAPVDRVTMHVFVESRRRQPQRQRRWTVKVMLTSDFAQRLLPPVQEGQDHYDAEQVLRQPLERLPCLVDQIGGDDLIVLRQVDLLDG